MLLLRFRVCPLWLLVLCWLAMVGGFSSAWAQDRLTFKDNHVQEGKVVGMNGSTVLLSLSTASGAQGQIGFDLRLLSRVDAAPPPAFNPGMAAYAAGDWDKALAALKPITEQFRGLPTLWAQQAAATLGDLYVEKNDLAHAESAYNDFRKLYPTPGGNSLRFSLGQARIALARNNPAQARQQLEPLTRLALKDPADASRTDAAAYGQAFYLLGQIQERDGNLPAALEAYLSTVTLFYQDGATTARAQKSADGLRAAHKDLSAP